MPLFSVVILCLVLFASIVVWTVDAVLRSRRGARPVQPYGDMFRQMVLVPVLMVLLAADFASSAMTWLAASAATIAAYALVLAVLRPVLAATLHTRRSASVHAFDASPEPQRMAS